MGDPDVPALRNASLPAAGQPSRVISTVTPKCSAAGPE